MFFIDQCYDLRMTDMTIPEINTCSRAIFMSMSTMFLALAVLLNINKWIYFTMRI